MKCKTLWFLAALCIAPSTLFAAEAPSGLQSDVSVTPSKPEEDLHVGDLGVVYENSYHAYIRNTEPFVHEKKTFIYGMSCYAREGGIVEMLKDFDHDHVLVIYSSDIPQVPDYCPDKKVAKFTISKEQFARMKQFYLERAKVN